METQGYAALLRGVNVGGSTTVAMADLRKTVESVGCTDVATYIRSGNVVLRSTLDAIDLRRTLERAIAERLGLETTVMIRSASELTDVLRARPFPDAADTALHVAFLHEAPGSDTVAAVTDIDCAPEELVVRGREIYLHLPNGMGRAKLPVELGRRLKGHPTTVRNWRTVTKLESMVSP